MNKSFYGFGPADDEARSYRPAGLVGARAASRLAGATTSGAPTAGRFRKGDAVIDQSGALWICSAAGSPGTFVQAGFASPLTTKGDVIAGGTAGAASRLGVGSDNQVLTADSSQSLGVKWAVTAANAGGALTQIAQTILSSTTASITFSGIPGTYSSLEVRLQGRGSASATAVVVEMQFNSDTGAHYDYERIEGSGSTLTGTNTIADTTLNVGLISAANAPSGAAGVCIIDIVNYAGTTLRKQIASRGGFTEADSSANIEPTVYYGQWRDTSAITSIKLFVSSGSFAAGTVATVYGIS